MFRGNPMPARGRIALLWMMTRRVFMVILVALPLGCGGRKNDGSADKTEIVFWHSFVSSTVPALNELIADFEREHPAISIKAQYVPTGDALIQKLITAVQSNTAPDISWIHSNYLPNLVQANAIYPMDQFVRGPNGVSEEDIHDIYPSLLQAASWRGTLYSIPMEATNLGLLYNKDLFRKAGLDPNRPPQTWDELFEYAKKLTIDKDGDGKFEQVGLFIPIFPSSGSYSDWMVWQWMPFLWQAGGEIINQEQTRVLFNSEAGVEALTFWKKIYDALKLRMFTPDYEAAFPSGQLAMAFDGPWNLPRWRDRKIEWAIGGLPAGPAKRATNVGGEYLAIFRQTKHPDQAWEFVKWLLSSEVQARWSMKSGYLPIRHGALKVKEYAEFLDVHPGLKAYVEQMEFGQSPPPIDYHSLEISRAMAEAIERATVGTMTPKAALDEAAVKANKLLQSVQEFIWNPCKGRKSRQCLSFSLPDPCRFLSVHSLSRFLLSLFELPQVEHVQCRNLVCRNRELFEDFSDPRVLGRPYEYRDLHRGDRSLEYDPCTVCSILPQQEHTWKEIPARSIFHPGDHFSCRSGSDLEMDLRTEFRSVELRTKSRRNSIGQLAE